MSTCLRCEIQTVYSCLNRSEITENRHQKLKPNRKNLNRGSPVDTADTVHMSLQTINMPHGKHICVCMTVIRC